MAMLVLKFHVFILISFLHCRLHVFPFQCYKQTKIAHPDQKQPYSLADMQLPVVFDFVFVSLINCFIFLIVPEKDWMEGSLTFC